MNPPALLAILAGALVLAGAFLYSQGRGGDEHERRAIPRFASADDTLAAAEGEGAVPERDLEDRVAELEARLEDLTLEVESTRAQLAREPEFTVLPTAIERSTPGGRTARGGARKRASKDRPAENAPIPPAPALQDDLAAVLEKATDVARRVGLSAEHEKVIGDLLLEEREKNRAIREEAERRGRSKATAAWTREQTKATRAWRKSELVARLGPEVAEAVQGTHASPSASKPSKKHSRRAAERGQ